ncbi:hypothetical protein Asal01_01792 [Fodinibius salicampi]
MSVQDHNDRNQRKIQAGVENKDTILSLNGKNEIHLNFYPFRLFPPRLFQLLLPLPPRR